MLRLIKWYKKVFRRGQKGQTAMEYALIIGGVSFVLYSLVNTFRQPLDNGLGTLKGRIEEAITNRDSTK